MLITSSVSIAQTETKERPVQKEKVSSTSSNVQTLPVKQPVNAEAAPVEKESVRKREKLRPAPKAAKTIKPVEKTEKTVE